MGKFVKQDPKDEPASELLKRIREEKAQKGLKEILRNSELLDAQRSGKFLPAMPPGWAKTTLGEIAQKITDGTHKTPIYVSHGVPFLSVKDFSGGKLDFTDTRFISPEEHELLYKRCDPKRGDILIGRIGTLGKAVLVDTDTVFSLFVSVGLIRFSHEFAAAEFLRMLLNSPLVESEFDRIKVGGGTHTNKLNLGDLHTIALPLPPLAEQYRIVAKVDELMALCDRLEAAQIERESRRDQLTAATHHHLNSGLDGDALRSHAQFFIEHFPRLTARHDQIKQLRDTVLDLAVRGLLVPQDPDDEPASELVIRIRREKLRLMNTGLIKKDKPCPDGANAEAKPPIPSGWTWTHLGELSKLITKGSSPKWQGIHYSTVDKGVLFIKSENVGQYRLRKMDDLKYVERRFNEIEPRSILRRGDILRNIVGASIGRTAVYDIDEIANINQAVALIRLVRQDWLSTSFLLHYLNGPRAVALMLTSRVTTAQPNISLTDVRDFDVPLPPLAEQNRIVAICTTVHTAYSPYLTSVAPIRIHRF